MEISLELVLERLSIPLPRIYTAGNAESKFKGLTLFSSAAPPRDKQILYIGFLCDILALPTETVLNMTICCLGSETDLAKVRSGYCCNLLHFPPSVDLATCYNDIENIFHQLNEMVAELDRILLKKGTIQELVDAFEVYYDNPVFVWDNSYQVIGMTQNIELTHPMLKKIYDSGRLPSTFLAQVSQGKDGIMQNMEQYTTMRIHYPPNITNTQFALRVFLSGKKTSLVLCSYFINSSATMGRVELFQVFATKINEYVKEHFSKSSLKSFVYEPFIVDLIEGRLVQKFDILERLHLINLPYKTDYRIYCITPQENNSSITQYLLHRSKIALPYAKIIQYQNDILILDEELKEKRDPYTVKEKIDKSETAIASMGAICGISSICTDLSQVRNAFLQAKASLRLGRLIEPDKTFYYYRDYYIYHILDSCADSSEIDLSRLYFKRMDLLEKSDIERKQDNMQLLEVCLRNNHNITNTAKEMHLHRNSVIYRLERIEEILRVSLSNPDVQFRLLMSFHIKRLMAAHNIR